MHKSTARLGLVALALVVSVYGCGDDAQTPTEPAPELGALRLEVPACGEDAYLSELSPLLPVQNPCVDHVCGALRAR